MKIYPLYFLAFIFLAGLTSCDSVPVDDTPEIEPLSFDTLTFEKQGGLCEEAGSNCIHIKLKYPKALNGEPKVRDSINQYVHRSILSNLVSEPGRASISIDSAANQMIAYYLEQLQEMPEYDIAWEVETTGEAEIIDSFAVVSLSTYSFLGGAHPNFYVDYLNYNINTGREVRLEDLITDKTAFMKLAEQKFEEARTAMYEDEPFEMDYFFFGEGYHLPENFAIKKEGLFFFYNPYEAAAYVMGPTEYLIPYEDLQGMINLR